MGKSAAQVQLPDTVVVCPKAETNKKSFHQHFLVTQLKNIFKKIVFLFLPETVAAAANYVQLITLE
jgi:hypothetical protein